MSATVIRGGGGKHVPYTARDCWNMAFDALACAGDRMEEDGARKASAATGVAWAKLAYLMERASALGPAATQEES